jgi:sulfur carrier protein
MRDDADLGDGAPVPILLNDLPSEVASGETLLEVARGMGLDGRRGVALALNGDVVPRGDWGKRALAAGDRVLAIQATQGG